MKNVLEMLECSALNVPDKIAFADVCGEITFKDLKDNAQKIATYFAKNSYMEYTGQENTVLFYMEKSVKTVNVMFGAVYCNAMYCYVDTRQSADRVNHIVSLVKPDVIITDDDNADNLKAIFEQSDAKTEYRVLLIDELITAIESIQIDNEGLATARDHFYDKMPLYVNFTSGSTGVPKGVVVGHASVIDFIEEFVRTFNINENDVIANQAPFDFDVSVKDIYSGLKTGARVQLIPRSFFSNPTQLMDYLSEHKATTLIWAVTAMCFVSVMGGFDYKKVDTINKVMFSGETMPVKQLNEWKKHLPDAMYVNLYGPTEITCNCTYHILDRDYDVTDVIPIGRPFRNEKVFLLDGDRLVEEPDTEAEICVSGTCLAIGYFKDRQKTEEVFVQNPVNHNYYERIYRTGDLGRYDENGLLYYTSRKDFQIKHMGQRIELGDIEASANSVDGVQRSCCIYDFKRSKIILFYIGDAEKSFVNEVLREKLPQFMIPGKTILIDEFPVNKNGKIDRKALEQLK